MTNWNVTPAGVIQNAQRRFWEDSGPHADIVADAMRTVPGFNRRMIIRSMLDDAPPEEPLWHERARSIMGKNFIGVFEAGVLFGDMSACLHDFSRILFSEEELLECCETHILMAVPGRCINAVAKHYEADGFTQERLARQTSRFLHEGGGGSRMRLIQLEPKRESEFVPKKDRLLTARAATCVSVALRVMRGNSVRFAEGGTVAADYILSHRRGVNYEDGKLDFPRDPENGLYMTERCPG